MSRGIDISPRRVRAWHFVADNGRLGYDDKRLVRVGETLSCDGEIELCRNGMHGSRRLIDALDYASGSVLCLVDIFGEVDEGSDKLVGRSRTVLWMRNIDKELHLFACDVAEQALQKHGVTDRRSYAAIQAKRDWLAGKISPETLEAAARAARDAARAAAVAAAYAAAGDAAGDAARAAYDAAYDAARAAHNERLTAIVADLIAADLPDVTLPEARNGHQRGGDAACT